MEGAMKKLALIFLVGLLSVSFAETGDDEISEEEIEQLELLVDGYDCLENENPIACKALIDNDLPATLEQCNKNSCIIVGGIYEIAGYTDDAIDYFQKALSLGNYVAAYFLGRIHNKEENFAESKRYYEIACEKINIKLYKEVKGSACFNLGISYKFGKGVRQDYFKASQFYKKACDLDNARGCNNLGFLYAKGQGVKQNESTAKQYYGKACDLGEQMGCDNYRILNESGVQ